METLKQFHEMCYNAAVSVEQRHAEANEDGGRKGSRQGRGATRGVRRGAGVERGVHQCNRLLLRSRLVAGFAPRLKFEGARLFKVCFFERAQESNVVLSSCTAWLDAARM